jgi:hypothetical protein
VALPSVSVAVQRGVAHVKADGLVLTMLLNVNIWCGQARSHNPAGETPAPEDRPVTG